MAGSHPDYVHFGYAYEAWLAADASDTISRAERDERYLTLMGWAAICGLPPRTVTPIAWIERRLATYRAAFGLDAPGRTQPERIAA